MLSDETIVLDPEEFVPERTELELDELGLSIREAEWGDAEHELFLVRQELGEIPADRHPPNRTVTVKLKVEEEGSVSLAEAAQRLQMKVGIFQDEGGWVKRVFDSKGKFANPVSARVYTAVLGGIDGWLMAHRSTAEDVTLTMTIAPYFYEPIEFESATFKEEEKPALLFKIATLKGTAKGLLRVPIKNLGEASLRALLFAGESRDYPGDATADTTAALMYPASHLTLQGGAEIKNAEESTEHVEADLNKNWTSILSSEIQNESLGHMTHKGVRRLMARMGRHGGSVEVRFRYRVSGVATWTVGSVTKLDSTTELFLQWFDLGEARIDLPVLGNLRWEWEIQARTPLESSFVDIDQVGIIPTELHAIITTPNTSGSSVLDQNGFPASGFNQDEGLTWNNPTRITVVDNSFARATGTGSTAYLGGLNFGFEIPSDSKILGIICFIIRRASAEGGVSDLEVKVYKNQVLSSVNLAKVESWPLNSTVQEYGNAESLWGETWKPHHINSPEFGVALKALVQETNAEVDSFQLQVFYAEAESDVVCHQTRSAEIRTDGFYRQHVTDDVWGRIIEDGFLPYAPPSRLEGRPLRGIILPSYGDFRQTPDGGNVPIEAQVKARAAYHFASEAQ